MALSLEQLQAISGSLQTSKASKGSGGGDWPNCSFIPDGTHKGRFISDPDGELYKEYFTYGWFAKGIRDPDDSETPEGFENTLAPLAKELQGDYLKFGKGRKYNFITYFYLMETDAKSDDWKPNTLYVLLGNGKFSDTFTDFITGLTKDAPEELLKTLDPSRDGKVIQIVFQGGSQGKCNISPTFTDSPAFDPTDSKKMGAGYRSLDSSYIRPGFDQAKYDALVKVYSDELITLRAAAKAKGITPGEEADIKWSLKKAKEIADKDEKTTIEAELAKMGRDIEGKLVDKPAEDTKAESTETKVEEKKVEEKKPESTETKVEEKKVEVTEPEAKVEETKVEETKTEDTAEATTDADAADPWAKFKKK